MSVLWLNGKDLRVDSAVLRIGSVSLKARAEAIGGEFLRFTLPRPAGPGAAQLAIRYRATLSAKNTVGAYRRQSAGDWYAFTTFNAIEARRAFPCFDEPRYKTPWRLTLHVQRGHVALANTRAVGEHDEPHGMKQVVFAETEPLPSSLIAFAAGPFDVVDAGRAGKRGVPVRIITPRGRASDAAAASSATAQLLERLEQYTGIAYPFDKLDHLALIEGAFGAVENPGLITYQQRILLSTPDRDMAQHRRGVLGTMAHELAHQWFGNLVTMSGWEDVWLSEGFATWMEAKTLDDKLSAVAARDRIMAADTRPVRLPMSSRSQMRDVYGQVVYRKGAATLDMIENWVGEAAFQRGIQRYLTDHKFASATTADFAHAISQAAGQDIGGVLSSFLDRPGVPLVTAKLRCDSGSVPTVDLRQEQGFWRLPVCFKGEGVAARCVVMEGRQTEVILAEAKACPAWLFLNAGASGYYRTLPLGIPEPDQLTGAERLTLALDTSAVVAVVLASLGR